MSYTIDITDCPTGTYSKVRTLLVASAEDYEYDKPVFSFLADDEQLAAVQAGVEDLEGVSVGGLLPEVRDGGRARGRARGRAAARPRPASF